jgi:hypothetical protein
MLVGKEDEVLLLEMSFQMLEKHTFFGVFHGDLRQRDI